MLEVSLLILEHYPLIPVAHTLNQGWKIVFATIASSDRYNLLHFLILAHYHGL